MRNIKFTEIRPFHYIKRKMTDWLVNVSNRAVTFLCFIDSLFIYLNVIGQNCFSLIFYPLINNVENAINLRNNKQVKLNKRTRDWIRDSPSPIFMSFGLSEN